MTSRLSIRDFSMVIALCAIIAFFALAAPQFLTARNLSLLMKELSITGTLAMGMMLIMLPGKIDLSAGWGGGLLGGIASVLVFHHAVPAPLAMLVGLLAGVIIWALMGMLIVVHRIPAFIITLGCMLIFKGQFWDVIDSSTVPVTHGGVENAYSALTTYYVPPIAGLVLAALIVLGLVLANRHSRAQLLAHGFEVEAGETSFLKLFIAAQAIFLFVIVTNQFHGVPLAALILASVTFAVHVLTRHTAFGRYLYAIGSNEEAAIVSGVPVERVGVISFAIMGAIVAITGFMKTAYGGASTTTVGELMELDAIAACVIGGVSLRGGRGNVVGVLFGTLIMACLLNGMTLMSAPPDLKVRVLGAVIIMAVWMDVRMSRTTG